ncbi:hypothetical protein M408DRAFT_30432 [Serendipita vermifera MAFF 305830]|uniref:Uncharacterized protein n=1 Tax=Serendipita vermifera MAFF 305830 TaxID=933852 RepID=A0A0C2WRY1_SERVB|nr:hypothetical protein M408DRAFT_30432 [Serendipita vermifera MAFF 305830]
MAIHTAAPDVDIDYAGVGEAYNGYDFALSYALDGKRTTVYLQAKNFQENYAVDFGYRNKFGDQFEHLYWSVVAHKQKYASSVEVNHPYYGSSAHAGYLVYGKNTVVFVSLIAAWRVLQTFQKQKGGNYVLSNALTGQELWKDREDYPLHGILKATGESPYEY